MTVICSTPYACLRSCPVFTSSPSGIHRSGGLSCCFNPSQTHQTINALCSEPGLSETQDAGRGWLSPYLGKEGHGLVGGTPWGSCNSGHPECSHRVDCSDTHPAAPDIRPHLGRHGYGSGLAQRPPPGVYPPTSQQGFICLVSHFLMVIAQGCMPALPILPATQVRKQQAPGTRERKGLRMWVPAELSVF